MRTPVSAPLLAIAVVACATGAPRTAGPGTPVPERISARPPASARMGIVPAADHHMHVIGPLAQGPVARAFLPAVAIPDDIAAFVKRREERVHDPVAMRELFTDDAILTDSREPTWYRGARSIAGFLVSRFRAPVSFRPVAFDGGPDRAHLAGYVMRGSAYLAHVHWSLKRGDDGGWRIGAETISFPGPEERHPVTADQAVRQLDAAGIPRGVILSVAYWLGGTTDEQHASVRTENDWAIAEAARHPGRLVAFCGVPALSPHAVAEVERCARNPAVRGIKLHLGNSRVDVRKPEDAARVRAIYAAANSARLALVTHLWTVGDYEEKAAEHVRAFLEHVLPAAPDVTVQIAHMAGGSFSNDSALAVFAEAFARRDPRVARVYFDVASIEAGEPDGMLVRDVANMRRIGLDRFLWASDWASPKTSVHHAWRLYRGLSPLTDEELRALASNVAPYLRQ